MLRAIRVIAACTAVLIAGSAAAQNRGQQPAPATPYKPVAIVLPQPTTDASFEAMRKQLGEAAERKDRAAMARLVVAQGLLLGPRERQRRRQAQIRLRQSVSGARPRQQGGRRLGHVVRLCRGSGRLAFARPQGRDVRARRSGLRRPGIRRTHQDDEYRPDGMGLSGVGRARSACHGASQRPGDRQTRPALRAHHAGERVGAAVLHAHCDAERQDRLHHDRFHRADRQRPDLLRQGGRRLEDRRLYRRRRAAE